MGEELAHCVLCHADFVPVMHGSGGHECPLRPSSFEDARKQLERAAQASCVSCAKRGEGERCDA